MLSYCRSSKILQLWTDCQETCVLLSVLKIEGLRPLLVSCIISEDRTILKISLFTVPILYLLVTSTETYVECYMYKSHVRVNMLFLAEIIFTTSGLLYKVLRHSFKSKHSQNTEKWIPGLVSFFLHWPFPLALKFIWSTNSRIKLRK